MKNITLKFLSLILLLPCIALAEEYVDDNTPITTSETNTEGKKLKDESHDRSRFSLGSVSNAFSLRNKMDIYCPVIFPNKLHLGNMTLGDEWSDTVLHTYGLSYVSPTEMCDRFPYLYWSNGYYYSSGTNSDNNEKYSITEADLGLKQIAFTPIANLYWGGGLVVYYMDLDNRSPSSRVHGHEDYGVGYWVSAGIDFIPVDSIFTVGLYARYTEVELQNSNINVGGAYYGFTIGFPTE